jgi:hypothetical protein
MTSSCALNQRALIAGAVASIVLIAGCSRPAAERVELAVADRTNAHATLASDGTRVAVVWAAVGSAGADVELATSSDDGRHFSPPVRVNDVPGEASVSGEQPPRVVLHDSHVDVVWVAKQSGIGVIRTARSTDGGTTFSAARTITPIGLTGARGWESAALADDGSLHVAWLDGRAAGDRPMTPTPVSASTAGATAPPHQHHHEGPAPQQDIFHAVWNGVNPLVETRVAANVCFCCKTAIVTHQSDVYVAWRHLFDGGVRDIAVAHSVDGGRSFGQPVRASADNWKIDACPDDGPAMAIDGVGILHVVWPTLIHEGSRDRMAIFHASSVDGGVTFSPRERIDDGRGAGASHPRLAVGHDNTVAIVWDQVGEGGRRVAGRLLGKRAALPLGDDARASSYPSITATQRSYIVAWTEQDKTAGSHIVVLRGL